jgi:hypothetical protein
MNFLNLKTLNIKSSNSINALINVSAPKKQLGTSRKKSARIIVE